ncbi:MAG: TraR/DksA family transcriptional regulator [Deltaproteobacteria bacterium]|nr:TraR/DksA family transcriptional regulator [Deltaproteobacteria bacterium]
MSASKKNSVKDIAKSDLFSEEELLKFREMLQKERETLLAKAKEAVKTGSIQLDANEMMDEVDLASATVEQDLTFRLLDRERRLLAEVEHALMKIKHGDFGYCEGTGEPISKRRLELTPWTRYSVKHKEQLEKRHKVGRGLADEEQD